MHELSCFFFRILCFVCFSCFLPLSPVFAKKGLRLSTFCLPLLYTPCADPCVLRCCSCGDGCRLYAPAVGSFSKTKRQRSHWARWAIYCNSHYNPICPGDVRAVNRFLGVISPFGREPQPTRLRSTYPPLSITASAFHLMRTGGEVARSYLYIQSLRSGEVARGELYRTSGVVARICLNTWRGC